MKLPKFLITVAFVTTFALFYVWQQSEIFRLAYVGQKRITLFEGLLDKNVILRYNIARNASLVRIGNKVGSTKDFEMPASFRLVKLEQPLVALKVNQYTPKKETLLARIFGIKRQAQARTINPQ